MTTKSCIQVIVDSYGLYHVFLNKYMCCSICYNSVLQSPNDLIYRKEVFLYRQKQDHTSLSNDCSPHNYFLCHPSLPIDSPNYAKKSQKQILEIIEACGTWYVAVRATKDCPLPPTHGKQGDGVQINENAPSPDFCICLNPLGSLVTFLGLKFLPIN